MFVTKFLPLDFECILYNSVESNKTSKTMIVMDTPEGEEFIVETILDQRIRNGKIEYEIAWKGFGPEENTWEPETNLDCPDLLKKFEESMKLKKEAKKKQKGQGAL